MANSFIGWQSVDVSLPSDKSASYYIKRADGSLDYGWYSGRGVWVGVHSVITDAVMWAQVEPQSGDKVEARHTRKNNSWYNVVRVNA